MGDEILSCERWKVLKLVENMPILIQSDMHHWGFKIHNLPFLRTEHYIYQLCTPIFMKIRTITEAIPILMFNETIFEKVLQLD